MPLFVPMLEINDNEFDDSLFAMVESSLCHGAAYFNCFSNITVDLFDEDIRKCANPWLSE